MPRISLVIPVYKDERLVEGPLKSVFRHPLKDFEVLVINDGSTDRTGFVYAMTSVVIPTCNRASRLRKTLESIGKISIPLASSWELLVVDNNSSDNTRQMVKELAETARVRVRYLWEPG